MNLGETAQEDMRVNMTPLIDVVFQLLIFFMCTTTFKTLEGKLEAYLPKGVGANGLQAEAKPEKVDIVITVLEEGTKLHPLTDEPWKSGPFRYGPDRVLQFQVNSMVTRDPRELAARLKQLHDAQPDRAATIDPRGQPLPSTYADIVLVLNTAVLAGFSDISFKGSRD